MIFRMFDGRHIDLSKIYAVGEIQPTDYFEVWFQLVDKPLRFDQKPFGECMSSAHDVFAGTLRDALASGLSEDESRRLATEAFDGIAQPYLAKIREEFSGGHKALMDAWASK